ncbi:MAG: hypothetical protein WC699_06060 [Bacteroidales bacterium]
MKFKLVLSALVLIIFTAGAGLSQSEEFPAPPMIKSYKNAKGKISKYNNFNYLDVRDVAGKNNRQAMGHYWEISYSYDSVFRQKKKFRDFVVNQIGESKGSLFFEDTLQVQFVIPAEDGNVWGRLVLASDKVYRLRLIKEVPFINPLVFDTKINAIFDKYVDSVTLPPRINYMPKAVVTRVQYSKFDHQEYTWNVKDTLFRQKVMGSFWDIKIEVKNSKGQVDKQISTVEILESYYRACVKAGGTIIKSRPRELIFTLPVTKATLWCRITVSLDGVYFVRALIESDMDKSKPEKMVSLPSQPADSTGGK